MKQTWIDSLVVALAFSFPMSAYAEDLANKWAGTYSCKETNFVTVKRLTFTKEKDGSIKIRGALVGFPDEVSIGEATAEPYAGRGSTDPDTLLASFSSDKYKPFMVIKPATFDTHIQSLVFTCYMKDVNGAKVHINGSLKREP